MSGFQLKIALNDRPNSFRRALENGDFIFLAECPIPPDERKIESSFERIRPLAEKMWSFEDLHGGLAFTDLPGAQWSAAEFSSALPEEKRNANIFYLSGSGRNSDSVINELMLASGAGAMNLVAVSGDGVPLSVRECRHRTFSCSTDLLTAMTEAGGFFSGSTFNPFYYQPETVLAQYGNLERKFNAGASFLVIQSGWDMLQLQTLAWHMLSRKLYYPMIARLTLLTPDRIEKIISGSLPGLRISKEFRKVLERELRGSRAQFEAAQYRRLEIQAAGCRLMGYSGVQISGVDFPGRAAVLAERLRSAMREFRSFEQWLDVYNEHQAGAEMSSDVHRFHLYDRVLRRSYPFDAPPGSNDPGELHISGAEKFGFRLRRFLFAKSDTRRAGRSRILKKLFASCCSCRKCRLPQHSFVCVENCPKGLDQGPCGGLRSDGRCEIGDFECVHVKANRISYWINRRKDLES